MRLFAEKSLSEVIKEKKNWINKLIEEEDESIILSANDTYISTIKEKEYIDVPEFKFNEFELKGTTTQGNYIVYTFKIPFLGNRESLQLQPSNRLIWDDFNVEVEEMDEVQYLTFKIETDDDSVDELKSKYVTIVNKIKRQLQNFSGEVRPFNDQLEEFIRTSLDERKNRILKIEENIKSLKEIKF